MARFKKIKMSVPIEDWVWLRQAARNNSETVDEFCARLLRESARAMAQSQNDPEGYLASVKDQYEKVMADPDLA